MRKFYLPAMFLMFAAGCSTSSPTVETNDSNKSATTVSKATPAAANQAVPLPNQVNQPNPATDQAIPPPADKTTVNADNASNANKVEVENLGAISRRNLDRLRSKSNTNAAPPMPMPATKATPNTAPDNSEITSTMNEKGIPIETRVFKNNQVLAKIEKSFADINNPVIKVYLKNGKVLTAPNGKISNTETAPASEILQAVGVK